jgi:hypothetical protein
MREKLNESQAAQVGLVAILALVAVVIFLKPFGGGEEEEAAPGGEAIATVNGVAGTGSTPGEAVDNAVASLEEGSVAAIGSGAAPTSVPAPPPPKAYHDAYKSGDTVVLMIVHDGGIDDRRVQATREAIEAMPEVTLFEVPVHELPRYASITVGLEVNRVPALVVVRPRQLSGGVPQASVAYGYQTEQSAVQAVRDASYKGPEKTYHPE